MADIEMCSGEQNGYPELAKIMGPYSGMGIYRRFAELNARNLLYLQAELLNLEEELDTLTLADRYSPFKANRRYAKSVKKLIQSREADGSGQWHKILEIRAKLKEYSEWVNKVEEEWR